MMELPALMRQVLPVPLAVPVHTPTFLPMTLVLPAIRARLGPRALLATRASVVVWS